MEMHMSGDSLLLILVIGVMAGLLAGKILQCAGFGSVGDLIIGVVGAFAGFWLLPQVRAPIVAGSFSTITYATMGAIVLLLVVRNFSGGDRFSGSRRWHV
jgi:uncharacterized membrane protein YeaQ/YmgE (transglycosylase-associated protein family)